MKKHLSKWMLMLLLVLISLGPVAPMETSVVAAAPERPFLIDQADVIPDHQKEKLESQLSEISKKQKQDVVLLFVDSLGGKDSEAYADDYYDYNHYGQGDIHSGMLLLISTGERKWHLTTTGNAIQAVDMTALKAVEDAIKPSLKKDDYLGAAKAYVATADGILNAYNSGKAYKKPFNVKKSLMISGIVGAVFALIVTLILRGQLKSVAPRDNAEFYEKEGSMHVTFNRDTFLYHTVSRSARPKSSSGGTGTHTSSSGTTHGGGGGSF